MAMMVQSNSDYSAIAQYLKERMQLQRFLPLAVLLYIGHLLSIGYRVILPLNLIILFMLILAFRLLDDLFDRPFDRIHNPDRIIATTSGIKPFLVFLGIIILVLTTLFLMRHDFSSIFWFWTVLAISCLWYAVMRRVFTNRLLHSAVILLKYPLFIFIIAPKAFAPGISVLLYFTFLLYEIFHDQDLLKHKPAKLIQIAVLSAYFIQLFIILSLPSASILDWTIFLFSVCFIVAGYIGRAVFAQYVPFINTFIIFAILSGRYF